jgi:membrane protease YdiL (CAAX protease family)
METAGSTDSFVKRHPALTYFVLTFAISTSGILILVSRGGMPIDRLALSTAVALFAGPSVAGLLSTGLVYGRAGLREFLSRLLRWRVGAQWYAIAILTTPLLATPILLVLSLLSSEFLPAIVTTSDKAVLLLLGIVVGLIGGVLEELGWTGFAVPTLRRRYGVFAVALIVGAMWAVWHVPITFFASVSPSGAVSLPLFVPPLFFYGGVLPVYRVLMVWVYDRTGSLLVATLMHVSLAASTFVILLPPATGVPLITYYLVLAAALCVVVAAVAKGGHLSREPLRPAA